MAIDGSTEVSNLSLADTKADLEGAEGEMDLNSRMIFSVACLSSKFYIIKHITHRVCGCCRQASMLRKNERKKSPLKTNSPLTFLFNYFFV